MTTVNVQGVGVVNFPDGMSPQDIQNAIENDILKPKATPISAEALSARKASDPAEYDVQSPEYQERYGPGQKPLARIGSEIGRQAGLAGRYAVEGGTALAQIPASALSLILDKALEKAGVNYRFGNQSRALSNVLTELGLPNPETEGEQTVGQLSRSLAGAATGVAGGNLLAQSAQPVSSAVGTTLASQPGLQATSALTSAGSSELARRSGAGPVGQFVAGIGGAVVPSLAVAGSQSLVRGLARGGESGRQQVQQNIDEFAGAGTTPTVGQATERRSMQGTESLLTRTPGGAGPVVSKAESQADELAANLEAKASQLVADSSAEQAGRKIQQGISGPGGFIERFRTTQKELYADVDALIPPQAAVSISHTRQVLADLTVPTPGAIETTRRLINPKIAAIAEGMDIDAANGTIPYQAMRDLRTRIGAELDNPSLASDVPTAQWKRLYGALSQDLDEAASQAGPQAQAAASRANTFTRAGHARIEAIESVINRNGGPEAVFRAATSGTKEGATTLRSVMQSLDKDGQKMVTATVLRRLGIAKAGVQGELGDRFSTESFLTNWNLLSPEAKRTLFDRYGPSFRSDMDKIAAVAANLRSGSKVFVNPSGTSQAVAQATTAGAFVVSLLTGQLEVAGGIAAGTTGANLLSRLMVNPRFVRWLAHTTTVPSASAPAMVNALGQQARSTGDKDLAAAYVLMNEQSVGSTE